MAKQVQALHFAQDEEAEIDSLRSIRLYSQYLLHSKGKALDSKDILPACARFELRTVAKQFKIIESLMQKADMIINCGDAGQEGELIQRWVMQKAGAKCPVKRLWISSLTEEAIKEGFENLKDEKEFQNYYATLRTGADRELAQTLWTEGTPLDEVKYHVDF